MSLVEQIRPQHVALVAAGVIAIALPSHLVSGGATAPEAPSRGSATSVTIREVPAFVVARAAPLFATGRVPPEMAAQLENQAVAAASAAATPPTPAPALPVLVGIVLRGSGSGVALAKGSDGQTQTLRTGERIDGWTLVALNRAAVVFTQGATRQTVALDFGSAKVQSASTAPAPSAAATASASATQPIPLPPPPDDAPMAASPGGRTPSMTSPIPMDLRQDKR
jgi:hypothetical protein